MSKKRTDIPATKKAECPAWMMTFGDSMSLLVCFFVMLIAFSNMEEEKLAQMMGAMRGALAGVIQIEIDDLPSYMEIEADGLTTIEGEAERIQFLSADEVSNLLPQMIAELRLSLIEDPTPWPDRLLVRFLDDGLAIIIETQELFHNGTSQWRIDDQALWQGIAHLLRGRDNKIRIMAILSHTTTIESQEIRTVWELGLARGNKVAQALETATQSPASRFGVGVQVRADAEYESLEITILGDAPAIAGQNDKQEWLLEAWR